MAFHSLFVPCRTVPDRRSRSQSPGRSSVNWLGETRMADMGDLSLPRWRRRQEIISDRPDSCSNTVNPGKVKQDRVRLKMQLVWAHETSNDLHECEKSSTLVVRMMAGRKGLNNNWKDLSGWLRSVFCLYFLSHFYSMCFFCILIHINILGSHGVIYFCRNCKLFLTKSLFVHQNIIANPRDTCHRWPEINS